MKIAFLSSLSPYDINNWSGTLYYIFHSLQKTHNVEWIGGNIIEKIKKMHSLQYKEMPFIPELYTLYFAEIMVLRQIWCKEIVPKSPKKINLLC
jgi:hypothetical protein